MIAEPILADTLELDPADRVLQAVISTDQPDRAGDVIVPAGLANRAEFLRNPVVLWAHQRHLPPIATCLALDIQPGRIVALTRFASGIPFADDIFRLYAQRVLRAWSIGFVPRRARPRAERGARGARVEAWDLLEYSAVPLPENPHALTLACREGLVRDPRLKAWLADPFRALLP